MARKRLRIECISVNVNEFDRFANGVIFEELQKYTFVLCYLLVIQKKNYIFLASALFRLRLTGVPPTLFDPRSRPSAEDVVPPTNTFKSISALLLSSTLLSRHSRLLLRVRVKRFRRRLAELADSSDFVLLVRRMRTCFGDDDDDVTKL